MSGGVGINMRSYSAYNGVARQDPFFYSATANLNARVYKLNLPFSLLITARNQESSLPNLRELGDAFKDNITAQRNRFVRMGASPHYKWVKLHLGHRAMNFSKFTLANLNFLGAGTELTPGNWRFSAMYGRLARAEPIDLSLVEPNLPVYERIGWGTKFGYGTDQESVDLIFFRSQDDPNSIVIPENNPEQPAPEDNLTIGLNAQKLFFERFRFRTEFALSALSTNRLDAESGETRIPDFLFTDLVTTEYNTALDAALDYEGEKFLAGVQVKRIDPNYRSHGAYFFNNDLFDLLGNVRFGLLQQQVNVALSAGVQSNNLNLARSTTTRRFVYNAAVDYAKDAFSAGFNFSNNTTDIGFVLNPELDSLNAVIITRDAGVNFNYVLPDAAENQHIFSVFGNIQTVGDDIQNPLESATSQLIVANFTYSLMLKESKWRFNARTNYNQNEIAQMVIDRYGAGFGIAKSFFEDKLSTGLNLNYFLNSNDVSSNTSNLTAQFNTNYNLGNGLALGMNWGLLRTQGEGLDPFSELTGNVSVQYNFNVKPKRKKKGEKNSSSPETPNADIDSRSSSVDPKSDGTLITNQSLDRTNQDLGRTVGTDISAEDNNASQSSINTPVNNDRISEASERIPTPATNTGSFSSEDQVSEGRQSEELISTDTELATLEPVVSAAPVIEGDDLKTDVVTPPTADSPTTSEEMTEKGLSKTDLVSAEDLAEPTEQSIVPIREVYTVTKRTSLRQEGASKAKVLTRLAEGTKVELLERSSFYWWRVRHDGEVGYVKAALLLK